MPVPSLHAAPPRRRDAFRIDTERLRQQHPIAGVVRRYGVELRRSGSSFTGRCPFHADGGRPNFVVFPRSGRWVCFRCGVAGDVIAFVQQLEQVSFREAVARLGAEVPGPTVRHTRPRQPPARDRRVGRELGADDHAVLEA